MRKGREKREGEKGGRKGREKREGEREGMEGMDPEREEQDLHRYIALMYKIIT